MREGLADLDSAGAGGVLEVAAPACPGVSYPGSDEVVLVELYAVVPEYGLGTATCEV